MKIERQSKTAFSVKARRSGAPFLFILYFKKWDISGFVSPCGRYHDIMTELAMYFNLNFPKEVFAYHRGGKDS